VIAAQLATTAEEGLSRLRAHAYAYHRPLSEVAADVVAGRLHFDQHRDDTAT
jgi:hypothetical protein